MKTLTLIGVYCLLTIYARAQYAVRLAPGVGDYRLSELKQFHTSLVESAGYPVTLTTTDLFPNYLNVEISFMMAYRKLLIGTTLAIGETAARSGYRDYSGSITLDEKARYVGLLVNVAMSIEKPGSPWGIEFDLRPGIVFNRLDVTETVNIGGPTVSNYSFRSLNLVAQPTVVLGRKIGRFSASALLGYQITIHAGSLYLAGNSDSILSDASGNPVTSDWSGLRLAIGIGYRFELGAQRTNGN